MTDVFINEGPMSAPKNDPFDRWYETCFKPAMERGPLDRYVARQAWYAALAVAQKSAPEVKQEPVAWMHDQPGRVDVIHAAVKKVLRDSHDAAGSLHRPLDRSEHYTIPIYAILPDAQAEIAKLDAEIALLKNVIGKRTTEIARLKFVVAECERMFGLIASGNFLPLPCARDGIAAIRELKDGA